jgi:hypothetical protein
VTRFSRGDELRLIPVDNTGPDVNTEANVLLRLGEWRSTN